MSDRLLLTTGAASLLDSPPGTGLSFAACAEAVLLSRASTAGSWLAELSISLARLCPGLLAGHCVVMRLAGSKSGRGTSGRVEHSAAAGLPTRAAAESLVQQSMREPPADPTLFRFAASAGDRPRAAARAELIPERMWRAGPAAMLRRSLGLHEFVRAAAMIEARPARVLVIELHSVDSRWSPVPTLTEALEGTAGIAARAYCRRFLVAATRRRLLQQRLTPRQRDFLPHLLGDCSQRGIAQRMNCSAHTVNEHCRGIQRAWGVRSRDELRLHWEEPTGDEFEPPFREEGGCARASRRPARAG